MTPQEQIAAVIVAELREQLNSDDNKGDIGWVDTDLGTDRVTLDGTFNIDRIGEALLDAGKVAAQRPTEWRCFHCGDVFRDRACAAAHFGADEDAKPACQIKGAEGGLVRALRDAEAQAASVMAQMHAESTDVHRAYAQMQSRHVGAVRAAEEAGYERGLADMRHQVEVLSRALCWHGDRARMATTREEWQQTVDEAVKFVTDNPEEGRPSFPSWGAA